MYMPGPWEWIVLAMVFVLVFGAKRLPEIGKGMGQGIREFKKSLHEITSGSNDDEDTPSKKEGE